MRTYIFIILLFSFSVLQAQEIRPVKVTELEKIITESKGLLVVNFWATWCKPCIAEIPGFMEAADKYKNDSVTLLLVSLDLKEDYPDAIIKTVNQRKFKAPLAWLDETNADYFCPRIDPGWSGAIPATLLVNNKTGFRKFFERPLTREQLETELNAIIGKKESH